MLEWISVMPATKVCLAANAEAIQWAGAMVLLQTDVALLTAAVRDGTHACHEFEAVRLAQGDPAAGRVKEGFL